ncbi:beta-lactamase/transpeptidase-like protein [Lophiostoma macrostomum CBS 122681]|uniref:Beta-lactamase/transpeptidase-like protein n=1 Tax=Lophiostoma macrostomum CBS 122681 TaxID=1314788 RepID=A0A6A6TNB8_9PLEO|nr:beta-lactamase/transpeptidase-like protein [Lophiostoma macrostomum CBS 122681]
MEDFEETLKACTAQGSNVIPGAACAVVDKNGNYIYKHVEGFSGIATDATPLSFDQIYWYASMNKLITSIAALQAVERGLVGLDDSLDRHIPEFTSQPIIEAGRDEAFQLRPATKAVTLRHLLTHSSGAVYDIFNSLLTQWRASRGETANVRINTVVEDNAIPRVFEAGEGWMYGQGLDWAGLLVARLNDTDLESYMHENIAMPLGITSWTFSPAGNPHVQEKMTPLCLRQADVSLIEVPHPPDPKEANGGAGLYGDVHDYTRVLADLLKDEPVLLRKDTVDLLFEPQFAEGSSALKALYANGAMTWHPVVGGSSHGVSPNHGLGGFLVENDVKRKDFEKPKETLSWSGATNMLWRINREKGIAMVFATHVLPWADEKALAVGAAFETAVWRDLVK